MFSLGSRLMIIYSESFFQYMYRNSRCPFLQCASNWSIAFDKHHYNFIFNAFTMAALKVKDLFNWRSKVWDRGESIHPCLITHFTLRSDNTSKHQWPSRNPYQLSAARDLKVCQNMYLKESRLENRLGWCLYGRTIPAEAKCPNYGHRLSRDTWASAE